MANHKSALKSIRRTVRQTAVNQNWRSRIRTYIVKFEKSLSADYALPNATENAVTAFRDMQSQIMRGVKANIWKANAAARKISRMNTRLKTFVTQHVA